MVDIVITSGKGGFSMRRIPHVALVALAFSIFGVAPTAWALDLAITSSAVKAGANALKEGGTCGEAMTAGQVAYRSSTTGKYLKADNNSATAEARSPRGIALNDCAIDQPLVIHRFGDLTLNAVLAVNTDYYLSDTPGGIGPQADLAVGEYAVLIGIAKSTTVLKVNFIETGVAN